jgi:hypothetical protein
MHMKEKTDSADNNYNKCFEFYVVSKKVWFRGLAQSVTNIAKEYRNLKMCTSARGDCMDEILCTSARGDCMDEILSKSTLFPPDIFC